uniref:Equilibrative nucleotide transporter 3-like n=1 Tax=Populus alba TaxID=43335 RepID=A0A4U5PPL0_POPAL|nr:hypothetical protein D5086_0000194480 [Populus alba]
MAILAYNEAKINTRKRNVAGYILFATSTLMLMVVDLATSGGGGIGPFIGICAIVAAFGVEDAHSFFAGLAASGALTSALRLITKAAFDKSKDGPRKGVMLFLGISTFLEFLCVLLYAYLFPKLPIVKYYRSKAASEGSKTVSADLAAAGIQTLANQELKHLRGLLSSLIVRAKQASAKLKSGFLLAADAAKPPGRLSSKQLIFQNIDYAVDLYLIYVLTLSIFPGFVFENTGKHKLGNKWYPLVLIAMYNVLDLISRYIPRVPCLKLESRNGLLLAVLSRFLLIPAFYFTAKYGDQGWMIFLVSFLGLTNGYLTVCVLTIAQEGPEANALGNLLVLFLLGGIFSGVALDWLWLIGKNKAFWSAKPACN